MSDQVSEQTPLEEQEPDPAKGAAALLELLERSRMQAWDEEWDPDMHGFIVKRTENWVVGVTGYGYNDRITLSSGDEFTFGWTAGFCYHKGAAAIAAARLWDPETQRWPLGFKKIAADGRTGVRVQEQFGAFSPLQPICKWCLLDRKMPEEHYRAMAPSLEPCADCGKVPAIIDGGGYELYQAQLDPYRLRYPRLDTPHQTPAEPTVEAGRA